MSGFKGTTGEFYDEPISARAIRAGSEARIADRHDRMGSGRVFIANAIEKAMAKLPHWITTDKSGGHKIKYATLKTILETVRGPLLEQGIRIKQGATDSRSCDDGGGSKSRLVPVYTDLVHAISGEVERTVVEIPISRLDAQSMGSALTYGRRYSLLAALGLATDESDDDGAGSMPRDLGAPIVESPDLIELKGLIDKIDAVTDLAVWTKDAKIKRKIEQLNEGDVALLRSHHQAHGRKLFEQAGGE
ncbi:MAG: ERF family protein [Bradyrhizobium sp.]|nr:ERF family protein [Bradyrhizobium sp.]